MAKGPAIKNLQLQPCCKKALKEIREKIRMGEELKKALTGAPFFLLVFAPLASTTGAMVGETTVDVDSWDIWGRAMKGVAPIVRNRCKTIAGLEVLEHKGGQLNQFWRAMHSSFR